MRQVVLDTETTGLEVEQGHRIIEVGCVELFNRRRTNRTFHHYIQPDRDIDPGAIEVHGITPAKLVGKPRFTDIYAEFLEFIRGAELVIHNAPFDVGFLNREFGLCSGDGLCVEKICTVTDTLALARRFHPGQRNSLDALCRRYNIDNSGREYHGALLDAQLLADVYLLMTGGQVSLLPEEGSAAAGRAAAAPRRIQRSPEIRLAVRRAGPEELAAHERQLGLIDEASGGETVWRRLG